MDVRFELAGNTFVWSALKAQAHVRKHGVRFEEAASVFLDPLFVLVDAARNVEARHAAIGFDGAGCLLYVVHLEVEADALRLISARRATAAEEATYAL
jgi:uncharacterized DUF497 family protein